MVEDRTDLGLSAIPRDAEPGFARYRHPQGWSMLMPVPDVEHPPEVIDVDGYLMHRVEGPHA